ncbi:MAG TPA: AAA family ATPase, partial [Chitinophagaceae bacterium]|nr:AAA family ATPase [Chitinophagaceae bacterium]
MPKYKKQCANCTAPFEAERINAKFCSDACRVEAARKKKSKKPEFSVTKETLGPDKEEDFLDSDQRAALMEGEVPKKNVAEGKPSNVKVPPRIRSSKSELIEKANARLRAKGMPLISEKPERLYFVDSGVPELNALTAKHDPEGVGGFPRKRITEIFGPKSVGKTTLVKLLVDANKHLRVLFIDAEGGLMSPPEEIDVVKTSVLESAEDIMFEAVKSGDYDLVVLDSVSSLVTHKKLEESNDSMGGKPKAMKTFI